MENGLVWHLPVNVNTTESMIEVNHNNCIKHTHHITLCSYWLWLFNRSWEWESCAVRHNMWLNSLLLLYWRIPASWWHSKIMLARCILVRESTHLYMYVTCFTSLVHFNGIIMLMNIHTATSCGELNNPKNGRVFVTGTSPDSKARYTCNEGYVLLGSRIRVCTINGVWTEDEPLCKRKNHQVWTSMLYVEGCLVVYIHRCCAVWESCSSK